MVYLTLSHDTDQQEETQTNETGSENSVLLALLYLHHKQTRHVLIQRRDWLKMRTS